MPVSLKSGGSTNVALTLRDCPRWYDLEFRIHPSDTLRGDDSRFETVLVSDPIPVLLVEGRPRGRSFEAQTFLPPRLWILHLAPRMQASAQI